MDSPKDSTNETREHITRVQTLLSEMANALINRAHRHDRSKLESPEKEGFDEVTGALKSLTYGSQEYKDQLAKLQPILKHHYEKNSHHPEHFVNGIDGMSLLDLIEMLCDWKAAGERHADGSMARSLAHNQGRFGIENQLQNILTNTAKDQGWLE